MTSSPTGPGRRMRNARGTGAALGRQIVTTSLDIIDQTGAQTLTLRGLARTIGVSAPAIYAHFGDLDAILLAVAERAFADLAAHLTTAGAGVAAPEDRLRAICRAYLDYAARRPGRYQVMFGSQWDATSAARRGTVGQREVAELGQDVLAVLIDVLPGGANASPEHDPPSFTDAVTIWVFLHGYAHQRLVSGAFAWPPGMDEHVVDCAISMAQAREPAPTP